MIGATSPSPHHVISRRRLLLGLGLAGLFGRDSVAQPALPGIIDLHRHVVSPEIARRAGRAGLSLSAFGVDPLAKCLKDMDTARVARSALSLTAAYNQLLGDGADQAAVARDSNDYMAGLRSDHPRRFGFFAQLPLPDIDRTLAEIAYAFDVLRADGVQLLTSYQNLWLGDPAFAPIYEELNRRKTVVYTHPIEAACCRPNIPGIQSGIIELGADTTRAIARWLFSGSAARYPGLKLIFSHAGGALTGVMQRLSLQAEMAESKPLFPAGIAAVLRSCFYDTAQAYSAATLGGLRAIVPVSQILFGSDYPYRSASESINGVVDCGVFSAAELNAVTSGNASRLLNRLA